MYTHGLVTIISTRVRHGYSKIVIVVDETVDPFNLEQVMWALSVKVNPEFDAITAPRMYEMALDPSGHPRGINGRLILDATTPRHPDRRGEYSQPVTAYPESADWENIFRDLTR